jgi:dTDP-glucose 4,6-dehydratase
MGSDGCGRAVVSGAAGFIGSHLVDRMLEMGWEVVGIDNLLTGSRANLAHLAGHPRFRLIEQDVCQPVDIPGPVDRVLHLASAASPADFSRIPVEILMAGTVGTRNLLELAATKGARFLLASTSEVYGDPLVHPQPEDYRGNVDPTGPRGCYDEAKRCAEAFTMAYHRTRGVETRIVRIFNTYGPRTRVDDGRVVPNFALQALRRQPLTVYGDGSQTRSLCYVDDLVSGLLAVLESPEPTPFNLGTEQEITVLELARLVCQLSGSSSEITFRPLPPGDPLRRRPDLSKARRLLGWKAHVSLEEGLQRTLDHFRSILS